MRYLRLILAAVCLTFFAAKSLAAEDESKLWSFSATIEGTFVPQDQNIASGVLTADHERLHLETRYNYEDRKTGSAWVGANFSVGENWVFDATPMLGGLFGSITGIAPGWELTLSYHRLEIYSESEFVFNTEDTSQNFYYNWSEVTVGPTDWLRFGFVAQRTRLYHTDLSVERGLLMRLSYRSVDVTTSVLNFGWEDPTVIMDVTVHF